MKSHGFLLNRYLLLFAIYLFSVEYIYSQNNLQLISPNGGEFFERDKREGISWVSTNIERINIYYSIDEGLTWELIFKNIATNLGTVSWPIPNLKENRIFVKIADTSNTYFDISNSAINIINSEQNPSLDKLVKSDEDSLVILCLGNSITYGVTDGTLSTGDRKGYRYSLFNLLNNAGISFSYTGSEFSGGNYLPAGFDRHAGFPGITDGQLLTLMATGRRVQSYQGIDEQITVGPYLDTYPADIILLHIGTNGNDAAGGTNAEDIEGILDEVDRFETDSGREVSVVIAKIIDRVPNESFVSTLNNNIETMVLDRINNPANAAYPDNIIIVDMQLDAGLDYTIDTIGTIGDGLPGDMADALHPNEKGYRKMAYTWFDAIIKDLDYYPIVLQQPKNKGSIVGKSVEFNISAAGFEPLFYQWYKNNELVYESTDTSYSIDSVLISDDGSVIYCKVYNSIDTVSSDTVKLYVADINKKVDGDLISYYNFEEGNGEIIADSVVELISADLFINGSDAVEWIENGLNILSSANISSNANTIKIYNKCVNSSEISIEAWIKPASISQTGPARMVTYSENDSNRNFTIGQELDRYVFRLRTTETSNNGLPEFYSDFNTVDTNITHIVFTRSVLGETKIYVNGIKNNETIIPGSFSNWGADYLLGLANEFEVERQWLGKFYQLSIFNRALDSLEVFHNYKLGEKGVTDVKSPSNLQIIKNLIGEIEFSWIDNSTNEDGFIIERSVIDDKSFFIIDSTNADKIVYLDSSVSEGIPYYYRIKGYNIFGESIPSDTIFVISNSNVIISPSNLEAYPDTLGNVFLDWVDNSSNEFGFIIERRADIEDSVFYVIDSCNTNSYIDTIPKPYSIFEYRVKAYNYDKESSYSNVFKVSGITNINDEISKFNNFELMQNFPNPFNPSTTISYQIPNPLSDGERRETKNVKLIVYDILGREVATLVNQNQKPGTYEVRFDGSNLPSGVYYYQLNYGNLFLTKKMLVIK